MYLTDARGTTARSAPGTALLVVVVIAAALVLYGAIRFPASVGGVGSTAYLMSGAGLVTYGLVAIWARQTPSASVQTALRIGTIVGLCIAAIAVVNHAIEMWTTVPPWAGTLLGAGMWALMFLAFGIACSATFTRERSVPLGILSSAWCAMMMAIVLVAFALAFGFAFMPHMQRSLAPAYAASGMTDASAFVARHLVSAASSHLFIAPTIGVLVGGVSALACSLLTSVRRRTGLALGFAGFLLFVAGVASIRFASSLERAQRPPFIDFGLAALGMTLASAHPLFTAIRRSHGAT